MWFRPFESYFYCNFIFSITSIIFIIFAPIPVSFSHLTHSGSQSLFSSTTIYIILQVYLFDYFQNFLMSTLSWFSLSDQTHINNTLRNVHYLKIITLFQYFINIKIVRINWLIKIVYFGNIDNYLQHSF